MWDDDILNHIVSSLPYEPCVIDAVKCVNTRFRQLVECADCFPRCMVSREGAEMTVLPLFSSSPSLLGETEPLYRWINIDGAEYLAGKEGFEKIIHEARVIRKSNNVSTGVHTLRLHYCRRLQPQHIPKAFISELCANALTVLDLAGFPSKAIDPLLQAIIVACGSTLRKVFVAEDTYISPSTVNQVEMRCAVLEELKIHTANSFIAVAVAKLVEGHPYLRRLCWSGSAMVILPALARHAKGLCSLGAPDLLWRSREQFPLLKLIVANNIDTLTELWVDCSSARSSDVGRYLASIMQDPTSLHPTALGLRLISLRFQEGHSIAPGDSGLRYFSHCLSLSELDLSLSSLESLSQAPMGTLLKKLRVRTSPTTLPYQTLMKCRAVFETFLKHHGQSLQSLELFTHAAYPELLLRCAHQWPSLHTLVLSLGCGDFRYAESVEHVFTDSTIAEAVKHLPNLLHFELKGFNDPSTHLTDSTIISLVSACPQLETLELMDIRGAFTDSSLAAFYDLPSPIPRLYSLKKLSLRGESFSFTFEGASSFIRMLGGGLTSLSLSYVAEGTGGGQPCFGDLLLACARYSPDLRYLWISGATSPLPAEALTELKKKCRLATVDTF